MLALEATLESISELVFFFFLARKYTNKTKLTIGELNIWALLEVGCDPVSGAGTVPFTKYPFKDNIVLCSLWLEYHKQSLHKSFKLWP